MGKRRNWIDLVKRIFGSDDKSEQEKKERRKRWLFGRLKSKCPITLPPTSSGKVKTLKQVEEQQSKHALAVAVATAAAAEVAMAAAQAAAEVVRLTGTPSSYNNTCEIAAIKIQTAFRGFLARKALRALKGLVKLQALVRGRAVRQQTSATLKCLQSLIKIQEEVRVHRLQMSEDYRSSERKEHSHQTYKDLGDLSIKKNDKGWDSSSLSKEAIDAILINRQEAGFRRERAMEYASSHQRKMNPRRHSLCIAKELETDRMSRRLSWLEQWVETQPWDKDIPETFPVPTPSPDKSFNHQLHHRRDSQACLDDLQRSIDELPEFRPIMRRSFNPSRRSFVRDDESFTSSPCPNYMTFTESAKARARSMSTPKQRLGATEILCHQRTSCTNRLSSPFPSISSDVEFGKAGKISACRWRPPSLKCQPCPLSQISSNDLNLNPKFLMQNGDRHIGIR